jgi:hypothetical protein
MSTQCTDPDCREVFDDYRVEDSHKCVGPVKRDAARYRWLRDRSLLSEWAHNQPGATEADAIDAAIDADMRS